MGGHVVFSDRAEAGRRLGAALEHLRHRRPVVLALPRGGVPVGLEVARALSAPLDVILVRKLGVPFQPELGMGAIGEDGVRVVNDEVVRQARVRPQELEAVEATERRELRRRADRYRGGGPRVALQGRTAVVVDDGIATGSTARAACEVARAHGASHVVLAAPVAPPGWTDRLGNAADEYVCLGTPEPFWAIGEFYDDFGQVPDDEVVRCLQAATRAASAYHRVGELHHLPPFDDDVEVTAGGLVLPGHLTLPAHAHGLVLFAHGSGSSRHSPRNREVAAVLHRGGIGTLLFDLLMPEEETRRRDVFDIRLLSRRLVGATDWVRSVPACIGLPIGYFGASTGAAAALWASTEPGGHVAAVVSRGGRPDLAGARLDDVVAPTLLIVGGADEVVLQLNREAYAQLRAERRLEVVGGATHLFEEPGTLDLAAHLARDWFVSHMGPTSRPDV